MVNNPSISVIIPYYNASKFIVEAVDSIAAQCYDNIEVIIVDDASDETIPECIDACDVTLRIFRNNHNQGPAAARNLGISKAKGEIIAFLDSDDLWPSDKLAKQLSLLNERPDIALVTGRTCYQKLPGAENSPIMLDNQNSLVHVHLGAMLVRKEVFDAVGVFNAEFQFSEDQDWVLRVREAHFTIHVMSDIMLLYRLHYANMTRHKKLQDVQMLQVLKQSIQRRRQRNNGVVEILKPFK